VPASSSLIAKRRRWEAFLAEAERAASAADWARCGGMVARFVEALWRRIGSEERALFPVLVRSAVRRAPAIRTMRRRHGQLAGALREMHTALGDQDGDVFITSCERLIPLLRRHIACAETLLFSIGPVVCGHSLMISLDKLL